MKDDEISIRVKYIYDSIQSLTKELDDIRNKCTHDEYHVNYFSHAPGALDLAKICDVCGRNLGVPTKSEVDEFLNK